MSRSFVCFDIGSDTLKMAVFSANGGPMQFDDFAVVNLGIAPDTPVAERNTIVAQTIRFTLDERKLKPKTIHVSLSGQSVFVRFVKLPAVEESKIAQIVRYEAQQQVPFPIDEVEWDHQVIGDASGDEIDIVLVAIKTEIVLGLIDAIRKQHIEVETVDVAALSLYNTMVVSEGPFGQSTALVDIGARTTTLIIAEGINLWSRTIPIGGDNFSQAIAKELEIGPEEASKLKHLVDIGQERPDGETAGGDAAIGGDNVRRASEAVGKVFNRLLAEIRRSIGYYRTQSQGSPVQRVLLSGGGSFIKHADQFLADKLRVDVAPLASIGKLSVAPGVDAEALRAQSRLLGDVVGLGLRAAGQAIMKTNLLPKAIAYQRELSKKKVFIVGAAACLIGAMALIGIDADGDTNTLSRERDDLKVKVDELRVYDSNITRDKRELTKIEKQGAQMEKVRTAQLYWVNFFETLKKEKPREAWFTRIYIKGAGSSSSGMDPRFSLSGAGSMGPSYGSPGASTGGRPPGVGPSRGGSQTRAATTGARARTGAGKEIRLGIEGFIKIKSLTDKPDIDLSKQVEALRAALEELKDENNYFSDVDTISSASIEGLDEIIRKRPKEWLARFEFEAKLEIPIDF